MTEHKPHSSVDWAETLRGHIILNIDEPYKTPALKALDGLIEQNETLWQSVRDYQEQLSAAEKHITITQEQLEALRLENQLLKDASATLIDERNVAIRAYNDSNPAKSPESA